jgi:hypothetical protein
MMDFQMASAAGRRNGGCEHFAAARQHLVNHAWQHRVNHGVRSGHR